MKLVRIQCCDCDFKLNQTEIRWWDAVDQPKAEEDKQRKSMKKLEDRGRRTWLKHELVLCMREK